LPVHLDVPNLVVTLVWSALRSGGALDAGINTPSPPNAGDQWTVVAVPQGQVVTVASSEQSKQVN